MKRSLSGARRSVLPALVGCAVLAMSGCSSSDSGSAGPTSEVTTPAAGTSSPGTTATSGGAQGGEIDPALVEAANAEGALMYYGSQADDTIQLTLDAFMAEYPGVKATFTRAPANTMANRFATEQEAGVHEADVLSLTIPSFFQDNPEWFVPLTDEKVPGLAQWPDSARGENHFAQVITTQGITYNSSEVTEADLPTTWEGIVDPKWKGECIILDPRSTPTYMAWLNLMYETYGEEWVVKLKDQDCDVVDSGVPAAQQVAAGAKPVAFMTALGHSVQLTKDGAPVGFSVPTPTTGFSHLLGVVEAAPHPNAALLFAQWYTQPAAQEKVCAGIYAPVVGSTPDCPPTPGDFIEADLGVPEDQQAKLLALLGLS